MKYIKIFEEFNEINWIRYTEESLNSDWSEYKKKEYSKWEKRSKMFGFKFPLFNSLEDLREKIESGLVEDLTSDFINNVQNATDLKTIEELQDLVESYIKPRDIKRILSGFEQGDSIPMPIILKSSKGMFIFSGNTRQNLSRIEGYIPKGIIIDLD